MQIKIATKVLTDGSRVHDVLLIQDDQVIRLPAYDRSHARSLMSAIINAVEDFTPELVD